MRRELSGLLVALAATAAADSAPIDPVRSMFTIHVNKSGVFKQLGHEHWVRAHVTRGRIDDEGGGHIEFVVDSKDLNVLPDKRVNADDQAKIQSTMQHEVLESDRYPEIRFHSTRLTKTGASSWSVEGALDLHGQSHSIHAGVRESGGEFEGRCQIRLSDFGMKQVSAVGGTVKVRNELDVTFTIVPLRRRH